MKSITMKAIVNLGTVVIFLLCISSVTSAQAQQRPSQRSFATVLAKIKEKKDGRIRMQQQMQQPEDKIERTNNPARPAASGQGTGTTMPAQAPAATVPMQLPSQRPLKVPDKPKLN